ncbi:MAG: hypothetical protein R6U19_05780 [Bacteroidales bacterium]
MRNFFISGAFWGSMLILLGVLLLARYMFDWNIPVFSILFSLILISFGIFLLKGRKHKTHTSSAVFSEVDFSYRKGSGDYYTVFGEGELDLRGIELEKDTEVSVSCVFGEMVVMLDAETNYIIRSTAVFGSVLSPDNKGNPGFGSSISKSQGFNEQIPKLVLKADAVFGSIKIKH